MAGARLAPRLLPVNAPGERPYRGGLGIARFRGIPSLGDHSPEDFVASATEVRSSEGAGLTRLENGRLLREEIAGDPLAWLGPDQVAAYGPEPALLVKLLDTRERLFVHFHPDAGFARRVLGEPHGKTEAWAILDTEGPATAYLGFSRDVGEHELLDWFRSQDGPAMLAAMNAVPVAPGDTLFVPAGLPHAIGRGVTLVELQQPVDLSIILEWRNYSGLDARGALLGLDAETAVTGVDRSTWAPERVAHLRASREEPDAVRLFPAESETFFRAESTDGAREWDPDFAVLVVTDGTGRLQWAEGTLDLLPGSTVLVPWAAGPMRVEGAPRILRCRPPAPRGVAP